MGELRSRALMLVVLLGAPAACARTVDLPHVSPRPASSAQRAQADGLRLRSPIGEPIAAVDVREFVDRRRDPARIGSGSDEMLRVHYGVETDEDVAPWLRSWVASALISDGLSPVAGGARPAGMPRGSLTVSLRRFHLEESTWARGVAELDLRLVWEDGTAVADRLTVVTTELMTEDDEAAWAKAAGRLAGWSAHEVAAWTRAAVARRAATHPPVL